MDKVLELLVYALAMIISAIQDAGYWMDGIQIALYTDEAYRDEAAQLLAQDEEHLLNLESDVRRLFEAHMFSELTAYLEKRQLEVENGFVNQPLWQEMSFFHNDSLTVRDSLQAWVKAQPDSWAPYAARAEYRIGEGWRARDGRFYADIPEADRALMQRAFAAAERDIKKTIELNPNYDRSYYNYLQVVRQGDSELGKQDVMNMAMEAGLDEYYLRKQYLHTLQPKWGGSYEEIRAFALESQEIRERNPRVYALLAYEPSLLGKAAKKNEEWEECVAQYSKAMEYQEQWHYARADCYKALGNLDAYIADLDYVASKNQDHNALYRIARGLAESKRYQEALVYIDRALAIDSEIVAYTNYAGWLNESTGDHDKALQAYKNSLSILPNDVYAAEKVTVLHLWRDEFAKALPFATVSAHRDEENAYKWFRLADLQFRADDSDYRNSLEKFVARVDRTDTRWTKRIAMVEAHLAGNGEYRHMVKYRR